MNIVKPAGTAQKVLFGVTHKRRAKAALLSLLLASSITFAWQAAPAIADKKAEPKAASAASKSNSAKAAPILIIPGVGVGRVRLGMTRKQVRAVLGKPEYVYYGYKEFGGPPHEQYKNYLLAFSNDHANGGVISIEVKLPRFKTKDGLSTASQLKTIKARHPKMTVVKGTFIESWVASYNDRAQGIGFCFEYNMYTPDGKKVPNTWPKATEHPDKIGIYKRGANWKGFYSSE